MPKRALWGVLSVLLSLMLACFAAPSRALAYYNNVSTEYPAAQDLSSTASEGLSAIGKSIYPQVILAGDIVDGTYVVPAYTSSRMCNLYASLDNATAKYAPNQAVLNISGGVATLTFYLSGAYTAVYFGTADAAAALAPADGVTPSGSYITDGSVSYDTGHGPFTVQLSSLNTEFTFAVYNGGTKGVAGGMWYTRLAAVIATEDFVDSYVIGVDPSPQPQPDPDPSGGAGGGEAQDPQPDPEPEPEAEAPAAQEEPQQQVAEEPVVEDTTVKGKLITFATAEEEKGSNQQTVLQGSLIQIDGLTTEQIAAIVGGVLLVLGALAAVIRFRLQMRGGPSGPKDAQ